MATHVSRLLKHGAAISIVRGRLVVRSPEGGDVAPDWLQKYSERLVKEILTTLGRDAYTYEAYSTGRYGKALGSGVTLQFLSCTTAQSFYTVFNVELNRDRDTKAGKKGTKLPDGHFRISKRHLLYRFWQSTGLKFPRRLAALHDYMGHLSGILFSARLSTAHENRLEKETVVPLEISAAEILHAYATDKNRTLAGQIADNCRTLMPDNDFTPAQQSRGLQADPTACSSQHGNTEISKRDYKIASSQAPLCKRPEEQTVDEWLADYSKADTSAEQPLENWQWH